jgi:CIC family chloride channel protein
LASLQFYQDWFPSRSLAIKIAAAGGITGVFSLLVPHLLLDSQNLQDFLILGSIPWQTAGWILLGQFLLCLIAFGSTAPGGILSPSLILGAALGNLVAAGLQNISVSGVLPFALVISSPTIYALTGMSAVFSAITRRPMLAIALVWEMTAQFNLIVPLMTGAVIAYLVAEKLFPDSIYQHLLTRRGINIEPPNLADQRWESLTAADIMQRRVETLSSAMTIDAAIQAFAHSHHNGFPIVEAGKLVGILTKSDLVALETQSGEGSKLVSHIMTKRVITVKPADSLTSVLYGLNHHQVGRLPVIDGQKIVGIITRADIIRCEAERLNSNVSTLKPPPVPSYLVYQTRSPATGQGRLLVPLSNPDTADVLLRLAAAIAHEYNYELECLCVIVVPHSCSPSETSVDITRSRQLLERAAAQGNSWGIAIHTQIRVAHNPATTILEIIRERHIDLLYMGWQGQTSMPGKIFGNTVDVIIQQAPCPVILVKLGKQLRPDHNILSPSIEALVRLNTNFNRLLVPLAGGPNAHYGLQLLPALISLSRQPEIHLCQFFDPNSPAVDLSNLQTAARFVQQRSKAAVIAIPLYSDAIATTVIDLAVHKQCDAIILGASREGLLQQTIQGNIPEAIARGSDCTIIVVRQAISDF